MHSKLLILLAMAFVTFNASASWVTTYLQWTDLALGAGYVQSGNYVRQVPSSHSLVDLRRNYGHIALKRIYAAMPNSAVIENNENLLELVKQDINFAGNPNDFNPLDDSLKSLNKRQVRELYDAMTGTYVVKNQRNYGGRGVGFCFGRALVAHNQALIRNIHPASIRKIWVIGNMGFWGHHVSTIVKSGNSWVAIDNFTGIMTVEEWVERMKFENQGSKELMFFITRAGRFGHANNSLYNSIDLFNVPTNRMMSVQSTEAKNKLKRRDFYQGFFMDFYEQLEGQASIVTKYSQAQAEEEARLEAIRVAEEEARQQRIAQEELDAAQAIKISNVSSYKVSQETIYCNNGNNPELNCNYQLAPNDEVLETSVTIAGMAQYLVQNTAEEKVYVRNIIRDDIEGDNSSVIVKDAEGNLTKYNVELVMPKESPRVRPYIKVVSEETKATQEELAIEVQAIEDRLRKFNSDYMVKAENASPLVRRITETLDEDSNIGSRD